MSRSSETGSSAIPARYETVQFPSFRSFRTEASEPARRILASRTFFTDYLAAIRHTGVVGERKNALVLYLAGTSRLLSRPMNVFVKGHSSSGKNFMVSRVLGLFPDDSYVEITSASEKSWTYSADAFQNKIVYVQEQNRASGSIHPVRLLISEGKLVRMTSVRKKGTDHHTSERFEARGPIAAISTTTQDQLEVDDETRHISLWMDDSPEQTKEILKSIIRQPQPLSVPEIEAWRHVQELVAARAGIDIELPTWFDALAEAIVDAGHDVRLRRYFPAFCQACRTVALLRSFQHEAEPDKLQVEFADFAIAHILLDSIVSESLRHTGDQTLETAACIPEFHNTTGEPVRIQQVADALGLPYKRAAERVQEAERAGLIQQANPPELRNVKRFTAISPQQLLPAPHALFRKLRLDVPCSFHHPITGEVVTFQPESTETAKVPSSIPAQVAIEQSQSATTTLPVAHAVEHGGDTEAVQTEKHNHVVSSSPLTEQTPLQIGKQYCVRPAPRGGYGVYEVGSTVMLQWYAGEEDAWDAVDAATVLPQDGLDELLRGMEG